MLNQGYFLQRLFSTFANGWPGAGLLLQRGFAGFVLLYDGTLPVSEKPHAMFVIPHTMEVVAGILLLLGLWTPVVGSIAAVVEVWIILTGVREPLIPTMLAMLGATIAMIGPGAWSLDARIFGRKHIETRSSPKSRSGFSH